MERRGYKVIDCFMLYWIKYLDFRKILFRGKMGMWYEKIG